MDKPYLIPGNPGDKLVYRKVRCEPCGGSGKIEYDAGYPEQGMDIISCSTCATTGVLEVPICLHCLRPSWMQIADLHSEDLARMIHDFGGPLCSSECEERDAVANPPLVFSEDEHRKLIDWLYDTIDHTYAEGHPARTLLHALDGQEVMK